MTKNKNKEIIAIGTTTQNNKMVNGQSMMFQLLVDEMKKVNFTPIIVDFGLSFSEKSNNTRVSGKFSYTKMIDNALVLIKFYKAILFHSNAPIYLNTSQSKVGFIRDYIIINSAAFFKRKIIAHQFGANYTRYYAEQSAENKERIRSTLQKTYKVVVEGDFTKEQFSFLPNYREKVISIPNGLPEKIDISKISPKKILLNEPVKMLYLSNMIESKGFWDVLEAFRILVVEKNQNVTIVFAGKFFGDTEDTKFINPEDAKKAFLNFIESHNLKDRVTYCGNGLYGKEKAEAFLNANFFLLPSYYINEGQPASVLEALAYGCVPITTKHRLIPMMVTDENGAFVNPKSPHEIADKVEFFINNPEKYNQHSQAAIQDYNHKFTAEKYISQIIKLLS